MPDGLRATLANADILSYRVMLLERDGARFVPAQTYPANAVACATTHDLPPLAAWWSGADIHERHDIGLIADATMTTQLDARAEEKRRLLEALADAGIQINQDPDAPLSEDLLVALHAWLARAPSALLLAQAEDLAGETVGQNLPGSDRERPNWRRRLPVSIEELFAANTARQICRLSRRTRAP